MYCAPSVLIFSTFSVDLTDDGSFTKAKFWVDQLKDAEPVSGW